MLLKFGARNFYCFKDGIEISLELGAHCPATISQGKPISNLLCVKGANGSGKTNALKILGFLNFFCCHSFAVKPDDKIAVAPFFNNSDPIELYCDFIIDDIRYLYELSLTREHVLSEKLSRTIKRQTTVFERTENKLYTTREFAALQQVKLRANASVISTAFQYETPCILPIYSFFDSIHVNVNWLGRMNVYGDYRQIAKYYQEHPGVLSKAVSIIKECDLGISDISIQALKEEDGQQHFFPIFKHDTKASDNQLLFPSQSLGTQTLFKSIPLYIAVLEQGGILVMDEFDTDFHPHILAKIVSFFDDETVNQKNAQMIFSSHNTDILEYMGKYRTVLINKEESESYGYRLDEIAGDIIRNDRPIIPVYNSGKIGGVPRI